MPKTVINDAKGVVQSAGSGTTIANSVTHSGVSTLTGTVTFGAQTVAAAGSNLATAAAISATGGTVVLVTGADTAKGVKLPAVSSGLTFVVINTAGDTLLLYPPAIGVVINGGSAGAAIATAAKSQAICVSDGTVWYVSEPAVGAA